MVEKFTGSIQVLSKIHRINSTSLHTTLGTEQVVWKNAHVPRGNHTLHHYIKCIDQRIYARKFANGANPQLTSSHYVSQAKV